MATLTVRGTEYTFGEIMIGPGEALDAAPRNEAALMFVSLSLQAGGHADATPEWIKANFPRFLNGEPAIIELMDKAYQANGIKTKARLEPGEVRPVGPAATLESDSTLTTSTAA